MQGNGRDPFFGFGGPFADFGGFSSFGGHQSLIPSFFGGRDPFDDPFFTQPFGGMLNASPFSSTMNPFSQMPPTGFIEHHPPPPPQPPKRSRGPIIEELDSDDEKEEGQDGRQDCPRKHRRSSATPHVEDPNTGPEGRLSNTVQPWNDFSQRQTGRQMQPLNDFSQRQTGRQMQPQGHSFTFQSSSVTYGGANGAFYTSSMTRRAGSDGVTFEERKEADSSTMQARHQVSRGLHDKGHTVARKLNSDGRVETMETLHNLNQDDLVGFEDAWRGSAKKHLPGWTEQSGIANTTGGSSSSQSVHGSRGGWALPSTETVPIGRRPIIREIAGSSNPQPPPSRRPTAQTNSKVTVGSQRSKKASG